MLDAKIRARFSIDTKAPKAETEIIDLEDFDVEQEVGNVKDPGAEVEVIDLEDTDIDMEMEDIEDSEAAVEVIDVRDSDDEQEAEDVEGPEIKAEIIGIEDSEVEEDAENVNASEAQVSDSLEAEAEIINLNTSNARWGTSKTWRVVPSWLQLRKCLCTPLH